MNINIQTNCIEYFITFTIGVIKVYTFFIKILCILVIDICSNLLSACSCLHRSANEFVTLIKTLIKKC